MITAAEIVRKKRKRNDSRGSLKSKTESSVSQEPRKALDLDDEIARLEAELAQNDTDDSSSSSSSSDSESCSDDNDGDEKNGRHVDEKKKKQSSLKAGIISLSTSRDERIESLPTKCLPAPMPSKSATKKTKKRKADPSDAAPNRNAGLEHAVREVLSGYVARSNQKLPFYCRVCQKQYPNKDEFFAHKELDFHKAAVEAERKATYCKLCRKQLTSPDQMKEHLRSKPHKERLERMSSRQRHGQGNNQRKHRSGPSSSSQGGQSRRQWV